jgi:DNA-binding PadR family transcriptional regulator
MRGVLSVRYAMLALLSDGPRCGPQLRAEFAAATGENVRPLKAGQVDTALQRLERDGLVESDGAGADGLGKRFRITAGGERDLSRWLRTPPDLASPPPAELTTKILLALRVPGTDVPEVVQVHRRYLVELMQRWTRIKQGSAGRELRAALAVDAELLRLNSVIRWLDTADGHLERTAARPPWPAPPTWPRLPVRAAALPGPTDQQRTTRAVAARIRISDADRERATIRLRDHYAEGRLTREELDERVMAALRARTFGELRCLMADLPGSTPGLRQAGTPPAAAPRPVLGLRAALIVALVTQVLLGVLLIADGTWPFPALLEVALGLALIFCPAVMIAGPPCWRRMRGH